MSFKLRDVDHGYRALFSRVQRAKRRIGAASSGSPSHRISIGIHDGEGMAICYDGSTGDITLVEKATIQEYGTDKIPARPYIRSWFDANRPRLLREVKHAQYAELVGGNPDAMKQLAQRWQSEVRAGITGRKAGLKQLAPATIAARARAGITQETPLDATGQLVEGIRAMVDGEYV